MHPEVDVEVDVELDPETSPMDLARYGFAVSEGAFELRQEYFEGRGPSTGLTESRPRLLLPNSRVRSDSPNCIDFFLVNALVRDTAGLLDFGGIAREFAVDRAFELLTALTGATPRKNWRRSQGARATAGGAVASRIRSADGLARRGRPCK